MNYASEAATAVFHITQLELQTLVSEDLYLTLSEQFFRKIGLLKLNPQFVFAYENVLT